jgi:hypothetical protein
MLPWAYENEVSPDPQVTAATQARNIARNSIQADGVIVATDYSNVMEGGLQQYLSYPPVYFKSNPDPALTRIIVGRGIPDMFNFWSEYDGQGVIRHKKGTCGSKELPEIQIIQHLKDFTELLTAAYQPIIHIFLYDDKMTYVTQDKKLFKSTAQVFLIISKKNREDLPTFIMQVCVYYTIEQWIIPPIMNVFEEQGFLNQFLEGNIDLRMQQQGFKLQMRIYGSYVMGMPVPDWRVNQLGLPPLNIIGDLSTCKPMEYITQCRIMEYLGLQGNPSVKIPVELIENYHSVAHRHSANFPFNIIYGLTPGEIEIIYKYREDNAVLRAMPINTDNDLDFLDREIQASAAAAAIQADIQAAKIPRFLTIEYPFLEKDAQKMGVALNQRYVGQNKTLTEDGKQILLSSVQKENFGFEGMVDPTRQNSFNKTLNLLKTVNEKIIGGIQQGINSIRTFTIQLKDSDGGPVVTSGGRKTRKNMKKTNKNKNKKQYKNKRNTNKRKKCKQLMRKTMNRKM